MSSNQGAENTHLIARLLTEVSILAEERRAWWYEENQNGVPQSVLAADAGVVTHTVYTEIRKYKESQQCQETVKV